MIWLNSVQCALIAFKNGAVGRYNFIKNKMDFATEPGHCETIFDIALKPADKNLLATASYDGTVKLWDILNMKQRHTLTSD
mmetsp:Transcript_11720/g.5864  ORF Transcript_11720/g.5864 Transcript_11720/m.5864 type:complete len:81 (-) Transcript_11720:637-879(-)